MSLLTNFNTVKDKIDRAAFWANKVVRHERADIPIQYIQATGTQYIDTGISVNNNVDIEVSFKCNTTSPDWMRVWGSLDGYEMMTEETNNTLWRFNSSITSRQIDARNLFRVVKYIGSNGEVYLDGTLLSTEPRSGNHSNMIWLFRGYDRYSSVYLAYCKMWRNGTLVRDYIPVKDQNNVVCLYDKISETYFYNRGSGTFIAGPEI